MVMPRVRKKDSFLFKDNEGLIDLLWQAALDSFHNKRLKWKYEYAKDFVCPKIFLKWFMLKYEIECQ